MTVDDLRPIPLFAGLADGDVAWVARAERELRLTPGDPLFVEGRTDVAFFVLLEDELQVTKRIGAEETVLATHEPGGFTGEIPLLTGSPYIARVRAEVPSQAPGLDPEPFQRMLGTCPMMALSVLRAVAQRVQMVGATMQQHEQLAALGKLAPGLAHELNNPAVAARRAADQLADASGLTLGLCRLGLTGAQLDLVASLRRDPAATPALDPLARSDREDALAAWSGCRAARRPRPLPRGHRRDQPRGDGGASAALAATVRHDRERHRGRAGPGRPQRSVAAAATDRPAAGHPGTDRRAQGIVDVAGGVAGARPKRAGEGSGPGRGRSDRGSDAMTPFRYRRYPTRLTAAGADGGRPSAGRPPDRSGSTSPWRHDRPTAD